MIEVFIKNKSLVDLYEGKNSSTVHYSEELTRQFTRTIKKLSSLEKIEQILQYKGLKYQKANGQSSVQINKDYQLIFKEITASDGSKEVLRLTIEEITTTVADYCIS